MIIRLLLFGQVAEQVGCKSLEVQAGQSLADIIVEVGCADMQPLLVAVNQEQIQDMDYIVQDGDEVALMPPFSGG